jgi:hypothetical protein
MQVDAIDAVFQNSVQNINYKLFTVKPTTVDGATGNESLDSLDAASIPFEKKLRKRKCSDPRMAWYAAVTCSRVGCPMTTNNGGTGNPPQQSELFCLFIQPKIPCTHHPDDDTRTSGRLTGKNR